MHKLTWKFIILVTFNVRYFEFIEILFVNSNTQIYNIYLQIQHNFCFSKWCYTLFLTNWIKSCLIFPRKGLLITRMTQNVNNTELFLFLLSSIFSINIVLKNLRHSILWLQNDWNCHKSQLVTIDDLGKGWWPKIVLKNCQFNNFRGS